MFSSSFWEQRRALERALLWIHLSVSLHLAVFEVACCCATSSWRVSCWLTPFPSLAVCGQLWMRFVEYCFRLALPRHCMGDRVGRSHTLWWGCHWRNLSNQGGFVGCGHFNVCQPLVIRIGVLRGPVVSVLLRGCAEKTSRGFFSMSESLAESARPVDAECGTCFARDVFVLNAANLAFEMCEHASNAQTLHRDRVRSFACGTQRHCTQRQAGRHLAAPPVCQTNGRQ